MMRGIKWRGTRGSTRRQEEQMNDEAKGRKGPRRVGNAAG